VTSPERMLELFAIKELLLEHPEQMADAREDMLSSIGVDLLDVDAMKEAGIRAGEPLVVAWLDAPVACGILVIAGDKSTLEHIRSSDEGSRLFAREETVDGKTISLTDDGAAACFSIGDHIVFVGRSEDEGGDLLETVRRLLYGGEPRLTQSQRFRDLQNAVKGDADVSVYVGSGAYRSMGRSKFPTPMAGRGLASDESDEIYEALGLDDMVSLYKAKFLPTQLVVDGYALHGGKSAIVDWVTPDGDPVPFLEHIAASPWLANVQRLNGAVAWAALRGVLEATRPDSLPSIDQSLAEMREEIGIDIEDDIINQIDGNLGFLIESASMMQADATIFLQVRDAKKLETTLGLVAEALNKKMAKTQTPQGMGGGNEIERVRERGVRFYRLAMPPMGELCFGEVKGHLVVTASTDRYLAIAGGGDGLFGALGDNAVASALRDPTGSVFYLRFEGLASDLAAWAPMIGPNANPVLELVGSLKDASGSTTIVKGGMRHQMQLTGAQPGMWKKLASFVVESKPHDGGSGETH